MAQVAKELWKNVSQGVRYVMSLDAIGNQTHTVIQPGRTFSISPVERKLNQESAYAPKADMFTNGTFILVQETDDTEQDEITSVNSLSEAEIENIASSDDQIQIEAALERIDSLVTAQRLYEELVLQDARQSMVDLAKRKVDSLTERPIGADGKPMEVVERETIQSPVAGTDEAFRASKAVRAR